MDTLPTRRHVLTVIGGTLVAGVLPRGARAEPSDSSLDVTDLGAGLALIAGAGANVVVAAGDDALLLVDGGLRERSAELLALLGERWPGRPVELLFNTNWRPEHTGANAALGAAGAKIIAHVNTKLWLGGDFRIDWQNRRHTPQSADALPTETFYTSGTMMFRDRSVDYIYTPRASTDGDVCMLFPEANVLVASDVVAVGRYPLVDYATGGWIGGLERATHALLAATDEHTRIVPAAGRICGRAELTAQLALCKAVRERVAEAFRHGMSFEDFVASAPTREFDKERGDPSLFLKLVYKGAWAHVRELGGII